jgi:hypothetical protein
MIECDNPWQSPLVQVGGGVHARRNGYHEPSFLQGLEYLGGIYIPSRLACNQREKRYVP